MGEAQTSQNQDDTRGRKRGRSVFPSRNCQRERNSKQAMHKHKAKRGKRGANRVSGPNREPLQTSRLEVVLKRNQALQYLHTWLSDKAQWRFNGKLQAWLIDNMYDKAVSEAEFSTVIAYLEDLKGAVRTRTLLAAEKVFKDCEHQLEKVESDDLEVCAAKETMTAYDRSRQIIQLLV